MSSTRFETEGSSSGRRLYIKLWYGMFYIRHAVAQLVEALRYKPEGRGFYSGWCIKILNLILI
jgi:hypothetical protein